MSTGIKTGDLVRFKKGEPRHGIRLQTRARVFRVVHVHVDTPQHTPQHNYSLCELETRRGVGIGGWYAYRLTKRGVAQ